MTSSISFRPTTSDSASLREALLPLARTTSISLRTVLLARPALICIARIDGFFAFFAFTCLLLSSIRYCGSSTFSPPTCFTVIADDTVIELPLSSVMFATIVTFALAVTNTLL